MLFPKCQLVVVQVFRFERTAATNIENTKQLKLSA